MKNINSIVKNFLFWLLVLVILVTLFSGYEQRSAAASKINYSQLIQEVKADKIAKITIETRELKILRRDGSSCLSYLPLNDQNLLPLLLSHNVEVIGVPPERPSILMQIFINWMPMIILIGIWIMLLRQMGGGGRNGPFAFGKSRAKLDGGKVKITFKDVAGIEEAKEEVVELVNYLKNPKKFQRLGGKIPCGVLMVGPPGTGKTLLAKAIAGEAGVPFFSISGSDFVEMFVGVGASRVRDLFETAKKQSPCIIFIDEIDAVGRHRGAGLGGGHDEREQTLNQLLVEMDGFSGKSSVIVIAATNRPDVLDPALLRPGRFDRQVHVSLPDIKGREEILKVHIKKISAAKDVNLEILSRGTPGMSGADLANLVNEAALIATKLDHSEVRSNDFERAKDKILMGSERRSMVLDPKEKELTAYHEAGHVVVGFFLRKSGHDPIYKASIIPRGRALGVTMFLPEKDRYNYSREKLNSMMCGLFGGRIAETIKFGVDAVTTGAANDLERATNMARNMIAKWGLSEKLGPQIFDSEEEEIFLGRSITDHKKMSEATAQLVDSEVHGLIMQNYRHAEKILHEHWQGLERLAKRLIEAETLDEAEITSILTGTKASAPHEAHRSSRDTSGAGSGGQGVQQGDEGDNTNFSATSHKNYRHENLTTASRSTANHGVKSKGDASAKTPRHSATKPATKTSAKFESGHDYGPLTSMMTSISDHEPLTSASDAAGNLTSDENLTGDSSEFSLTFDQEAPREHSDTTNSPNS